jgi:very-short-patch-repair endonuclease
LWERIKVRGLSGMKKPQRTSLAKRLRHEQTEAEQMLWARLRNMQLEGAKFRRQQPVGVYVVDFVSFGKKLVVEIDGGQHNETPTRERDEQRTKRLEANGFRVMRFWNNDVLLNPEGVLTKISEALAEVSPSPSLSHRGRGKL